MKFNHILIALVSCVSLTAFAAKSSDQTPTRGANGVYLNGSLYLLDLVEAGVQNNPYIETIVPDPTIQKWVSQSLPTMGLDVQNAVSRKLTDLKMNYSFGWAFYLTKVAGNLHFTLVDAVLNNLTPEDTTLHIPASMRVQLTARRNNRVTINRFYWNSLSATNKAALIFHELFSTRDYIGDTRQLVGDMFSPLFKKNDKEFSNAFLGGWDNVTTKLLQAMQGDRLLITNTDQTEVYTTSLLVTKIPENTPCKLYDRDILFLNTDKEVSTESNNAIDLNYTTTPESIRVRDTVAMQEFIETTLKLKKDETIAISPAMRRFVIYQINSEVFAIGNEMISTSSAQSPNKTTCISREQESRKYSNFNDSYQFDRYIYPYSPEDFEANLISTRVIASDVFKDIIKTKNLIVMM